ncbi:MAG TPA: pyrroloquinoline quinone biosynthesis peptide chaperone PqqD [Nitrospira sp.]|nr:pyrroloquinoline quinone biosynthesis peptide chaperone PqqD [Nitrospira sp.]
MTLTTVKPRLSFKVRLRFDGRTGRHLLLYPERGLELNDTATVIARLCTGEWTIDEMVDHLTRAYDAVSPTEIRREVCEFLDVLADRGLLQIGGGKLG